MKTSGLSDPMLFLSTRNYIKYKDTERIKKEKDRKDIPHKHYSKKISLAILILDKVDSRKKTIMNHKENGE